MKNEPISEDVLRNTRAWAAARVGSLSGAEVIVGAIDELLERCICRGNWRELVKEFEPLIGTRFKDEQGHIFTFFGLVITDEDYYYGMNGKSGMRLLSCVGSLDKGHGFTALDGPRPEGKSSLELRLRREV